MPALVNINGTPLRELLKQQRDIIEAADRLINALAMSCPHSRDYPGDDDGWELARKNYRDELDRASQIRNAAFQRAQELLAQEGPQSWRAA